MDIAQTCAKVEKLLKILACPGQQALLRLLSLSNKSYASSTPQDATLEASRCSRGHAAYRSLINQQNGQHHLAVGAGGRRARLGCVSGMVPDAQQDACTRSQASACVML